MRAIAAQTAASVVVCLLIATSAQAALIAADPYPVGPNRAAGEYAADTSIQSTANDGLVTPGFATGRYTGGTGTSNFVARATGYDHAASNATSATGRVQWIGPALDTINRSVARNLSPAAPASSTYYMSHLMSRASIPQAGGVGFVLTGYGNTTFPTLGTTTGNLLGVYVGFAQDGVADNFGNLVIRTRNEGAATSADTVLVNGASTSTASTVYHVVTKVDVNVGGGSADTVTWWLNPTDGSSDASLTATADATGSISTFAISTSADLVRLNYAARQWNGSAFFDEPRLSTDLAGLGLAVPEPAGLAVLGISTLALLRRRGS
ncbi:MAG TPA: hypothetical protein VGR35_09160 [Tepidisphaeraceae bacterium]|nr:hypothetical protein [Tepidisphaeraceae bacterium]